jgi:hypothetical protein
MYGSLLVPRLARGGEIGESSWLAGGVPDNYEAPASSYKNGILMNELYESKSNVEELRISVHLWSKHVGVDKSSVVSIAVLLVTFLGLIWSCHTVRRFSLPASPWSGVSNIFLGSLLMRMFDINTANTVALKHKMMPTFLDPLHKVQNTIKIIEQYVENITVNWKSRLPQQNHRTHCGQP